MHTIAIFGSARVEPDRPDYQTAMALGKALARAGYAVMTGGYAGVMEAISRGAAEAGGHVIGVTTDEIENYSGVRVNPWVKEEVRYALLRDRLLHMAEKASGYVAMPGGVGTLHEIAETWELMRLRSIPRRPLICYGAFWEEMLVSFKASSYVSDDYRQLMRFAHRPESVISILETWSDEQRSEDGT